MKIQKTDEITAITLTKEEPLKADLERYGEIIRNITGSISFEGPFSKYCIKIPNDIYDELKNYAIDGLLATKGTLITSEDSTYTGNTITQSEVLEIKFMTHTKDSINIKHTVGQTGQCKVTINGLDMMQLAELKKISDKCFYDNKKFIK